MELNFSDILQVNNADAIFVNTNDEFLSEFTNGEHNMLFILTGFTGSNGIAVIMRNCKLFFTDGRYLLQAKNEISSDYKILHINTFEKTISDMGIKVILLDEQRFAAKFCINIQVKYPNLQFKHWVHNIVPAFKNNGDFYNIPETLTGESSESKIQKVRKYMKDRNFDAYYITDCQNICWLLNIRGKDEEFTPIYKTHLLLTEENIELTTSGECPSCEKVLIDNQITFATYNGLKCEKQFDCFITKLKAIKNKIEIDGIKNAHRIDGQILTQFLINLEMHYHGLTEFSIGTELLCARKQNPYFISPSFATICGYNKNGAIVHYNATKQHTNVVSDGVLLLDSGGQYCDVSGQKRIFGTTDVTRTIYIGDDPSEEYKKVFTLVLKGHIAIAMAEFPIGTQGKDLDVLARRPLIDAGYNYDHGTGHGVSAFLSVHEAGVGISPRADGLLQEGMLVSNEPGCYIEGKFGIRIESLVLVVKKSECLLGFETITLVPIQKKSVNLTMLDKNEKEWLRNYNNITVTNCS